MITDTFKRLARVFSVHTDRPAVLQDVADLINEWGDGAYLMAAEMSWREDSGLIYAPEAGHWNRVKRELGHRRGWRSNEPEAVFTTNLDRAWACA